MYVPRMIPLLNAFSRKNIKTFYAMYVPGMIPLLKVFSRKNIKTFYAMYVPGMIPLLKAFSLKFLMLIMYLVYPFTHFCLWFAYPVMGHFIIIGLILLREKALSRGIILGTYIA
jgi:hypothetical protein